MVSTVPHQSSASSSAVLTTHAPTSQQPERAQLKKAVRATLILFPLLGITNLLFFVNNPKQKTHEKIYMLFNATMQSSQVRERWKLRP